jgi:hypothetical protein
VSADVEGTPDNPEDDDLWYTGRFELEYRAVGTNPKDEIDIELLSPATLSYVERDTGEWTLDTSETVTVSHLHAYGVVRE